MNRRQRIIISVTGIFIVLLILIGLTYGYFLTRISGNINSSSISVITADLELVYGDGTTELLTSNTPIEPGKFTSSKDFTVTNTGTALIDSYAVILEDFSVTYATDAVIDGVQVKAGDVTKMVFPEDMKMEITCTAYKNYGESDQEEASNCNWVSGSLPTQNDILITNAIDVGVTHVYELTLTYVDSGIDQSADMNKIISGKIDIIDTKSTIDLEGTVAAYETGDYVVVNSTPIISEIVDGSYKVIGIEPGEHTISIKYKDESGVEQTRGSQALIIKRGDETSVKGSEVTVTDESRTVTVDITDTYEIVVDKEINEFNPFEKGTLAHTILKNAYNIANEQEALGYAKFRNKPLSIPGLETSTTKVDQGPESNESSYSYIRTVAGDSTKYYTYGDSYNYTNSKYTIVNSDNTDIKVTQDYKELKNKYIVSYSGSTSSEPANVSSLSQIYYVTDVDDVNIYYEIFSYGLSMNEKYILYGDSYTFNSTTGYYKIVNRDGSKLKSVSYKDNISKLKGMYTDSYTGGIDPNNSTHVNNLGRIYKISKNSTENEVKYYKVNSSIESLESSLSTAKDDFGTSYYYRGNVKNNYINFAGKCWRIVRIDGQGNIKLILEAKKICQNISSSDKRNAFLTNRGNFGYSYTYPVNSAGDIGTYKHYLDNYLNPTYATSGAQVNLYKTFQNELSSYLSYLTSGNWCIDNKKYSRTGKLITGLELLDYQYNGTELCSDFSLRVNKKESKLYCNDTLTNNYSDNTPMYVATLTADEVTFAGLLANGMVNKNIYLQTSTQYNDYWTLTPYSNGGTSSFIYEVIDSYGYLSAERVETGDYLRPAINLVSGISFGGGTGLQTDPYTIK